MNFGINKQIDLPVMSPCLGFKKNYPDVPVKKAAVFYLSFSVRWNDLVVLEMGGWIRNLSEANKEKGKVLT